MAHVADNLRIWAERFVALSESSETVSIEPYDAELLGIARRYGELPLLSVLWSLEESTATWLRGLSRCSGSMSFVHPDRGGITLADVVVTNAHDVVHHLYDIGRCIAS